MVDVSLLFLSSLGESQVLAWPDALDRDRFEGDSGDSGRPLVTFPRPGRKVLICPAAVAPTKGARFLFPPRERERSPSYFQACFSTTNCKRIRTQEIPEISTQGKS